MIEFQPKSAKVAKLSEDSTPGSVSNGGEGQTAISLDELIEIFNEQVRIGFTLKVPLFLAIYAERVRIKIPCDFILCSDDVVTTPHR